MTGNWLISRRRFILAASGFVVFSPERPAFARLGSSNFLRLWQNHPMRDQKSVGDRWPCRKVLDIRCLLRPEYLTRDQCSIRLGVAIRKSFPNLRYADFPEIVESDNPASARRAATCASLLRTTCGHKNDELHFIRAVELAASLLEVSSASTRSKYPKFAWLGQPEVHARPAGRRSRFRAELAERNGLIFIEHFALGRPSPMQGCHIDLWCGRSQRTKNELYYRGASASPDLRYDDVASRVIFWEIA